MTEWFDLANADVMYNNIVSKVINSQTIAKCLKHSSGDALEQSDLTQDEIFALVNQTNKDSCRIFNIPPTYNVTEEQRAEIRIYETSIVTDDPLIYDIGYCFDIVCHQNIWLLDSGERRVMKIADGIIKALHGVDIGGIGRMRFFNRRKPEVMKLQFYNDNFCGYKLFAYVKSGGSDERSC